MRTMPTAFGLFHPSYEVALPLVDVRLTGSMHGEGSTAVTFALLARRGIWSPPLVGRLKPIKSRSRNSAFGVFAAFVIEIPSEFRSSLFECDPPIKHPIMATGQQKIAKCTGKAIV
jgi:hypothetical protein